MAILSVQRLLENAQGGEKLTTDDRRRVVAYLTGTQPDVSNADMAEWFQVSEGTIRKDKMTIRQAMANELKEEDIGLVIADLLYDFKRQIRDIEKSKESAKDGSMAKLAHCTSVMELRLKTVKALQDLGYLPKNLGSMTVDKYTYAAIVAVDGSVDTRPIHMFDEATQNRLSLTERKEDDAQVTEAEFTDLPPARQVDYENSAPGDSPEDIGVVPASEEGQASNPAPSSPSRETE